MTRMSGRWLWEHLREGKGFTTRNVEMSDHFTALRGMRVRIMEALMRVEVERKIEKEKKKERKRDAGRRELGVYGILIAQLLGTDTAPLAPSVIPTLADSQCVA
jgi:hypothetical protein